MQRNIAGLPERLRKDYLLKTLLTSGASILSGSLFFLYNAVMWLLYGIAWNASICVYYLLLTGIRIVIVRSQKDPGHRERPEGADYRRNIYRKTHYLLFAMNFALIAPIAIMVRGGRSYSFGMIPAIAMASYTTWKIITAVIHFRRSRSNRNILVSELRTINLIDALVSVMSLQNTLIMANNAVGDGITRLTAWTNSGILLLILLCTIRSFCRKTENSAAAENKESSNESRNLSRKRKNRNQGNSCSRSGGQ